VEASLQIFSGSSNQSLTAEIVRSLGAPLGRATFERFYLPISTAGTLLMATETLLARGAAEVCSCATHGVFAGDGTVYWGTL